jgi:hypothetical protein
MRAGKCLNDYPNHVRKFSSLWRSQSHEVLLLVPIYVRYSLSRSSDSTTSVTMAVTICHGVDNRGSEFGRAKSSNRTVIAGVLYQPNVLAWINQFFITPNQQGNILLKWKAWNKTMFYNSKHCYVQDSLGVHKLPIHKSVYLMFVVNWDLNYCQAVFQNSNPFQRYS